MRLLFIAALAAAVLAASAAAARHKREVPMMARATFAKMLSPKGAKALLSERQEVRDEDVAEAVSVVARAFRFFSRFTDNSAPAKAVPAVSEGAALAAKPSKKVAAPLAQSAEEMQLRKDLQAFRFRERRVSMTMTQASKATHSAERASERAARRAAEAAEAATRAAHVAKERAAQKDPVGAEEAAQAASRAARAASVAAQAASESRFATAGLAAAAKRAAAHVDAPWSTGAGVRTGERTPEREGLLEDSEAAQAAADEIAVTGPANVVEECGNARFRAGEAVGCKESPAPAAAQDAAPTDEDASTADAVARSIARVR